MQKDQNLDKSMSKRKRKKRKSTDSLHIEVRSIIDFWFLKKGLWDIEGICFDLVDIIERESESQK